MVSSKRHTQFISIEIIRITSPPLGGFRGPGHLGA